MLLRSLATRAMIVCSILCAFAFNGDDTSFYFTLSSDRIYFPGSSEIAVTFSGNGAGATKIYLRAFKVNDPVDFFLAQKDPHSPTLTALTPPNTFDMLNLGFRKVSRDIRYAARDVMPADARRAIRDATDLNSTRADKEKEQAAQKKGTTAPRQNPDLPVDDIPKGAERYQIVAAWDYQLAKRQGDDDWHYESIPVPVKEKGVYLIEARARGKRAITTLIVSELGMVVKQSSMELLTYVVNTRSGERVGDFPLVITRGGLKLTEDETGSDGIFRMQVPALPAPEENAEEPDMWRWDYQRRQILVVGEKDGNFIISDPYSYGYGGGTGSKIYLQTDRPVYRPAQMVYFRGILRARNADGTYLNPSGSDTVLTEIHDARGDLLRRDTLRVSDMGTFNGQLMLGDEPPLGVYSVKAVRAGESYEGEQWFSFSVEEYKKPEYKVSVTADRKQYIRGDAITATVAADYYFGSPVVNAEVEYFVFRARYWRPWWRGSQWAYLYDGEDDDYSTYRMEMVHSDKGVLGPDGKLAITYKTDGAADQDYVYRVQANVVDNSRRSISGALSVEVTRGEFYISTSTDRYVYKPGDEAVLTVEMATFDADRPVAQPFDIKVLRTWWEKMAPTDSTMEPEYKKRSETIWTGRGSTDGSGKGKTSYRTTQAGYFEVEITARDARGTEITESSYIYVSDASYANWYREGSSDVQIIPDKPAYKPGETMSALVIMPAANIDALITVEGAILYKHQVERLNATSAILRIPIEERYAPSVYLSATAIVNDEMYSESQRIAVVPEGKLLSIELETDKEIYKPGEKGSLVVRALDEKGAPVSNVDIALGMVDEAVYAIRPDATPDIQRYFYGTRWNEVSTSSSLAFSVYGDAVRIDKDAADALYGANRSSRRDQRYASNGRDARSLAFGDVKGTMFVQPVTRKNFKDVMLWNPSVRTGSDGRARIDIDFPDNLTTWRITARGVTANTAVGQATARVIARKDLMVRMETPRFMIQGDELLIATTVHNYLGSEKVTKLEFTGQNVTSAESGRTLTIPANGEKRIDWKVTAPQSGEASLTIKALTNEESDAMELQVPVLPRGMRLATGALAQIGEQTSSRSLNLQMPAGTDPTTGELYVTLSPSLAGSMLGALDSLIGYPYGCVEQTMSRFLPTIAIADALRKLDVPFSGAKRAELPKMVSAGLSKLYGMQHDDGGWGWWANDRTDPFMTAYVIYGMTIARNAGYGVLEERYDNGVTALTRLLESGRAGDSTVIDLTSQAYMVYVLATVNQGKTIPALTDRIATLSRSNGLNDYALALLTLASRYQNGAQTTALVSRLEKNASTGEEWAFWQAKGRKWYWQDDQVEASAFAVKALLAVKGETDLVDKGVRWLLSQKQGAVWHNTRRTSMVILALVDYLKVSGELAPDYNVAVKVNGQEVLSRRITRADVYQPEQRIKVESASLRSGTNVITLEKSGQGRLYSSARMTYYATGTALKPASAGFKVSREYHILRKERRGDLFVYTKRPFTGTVKTGDEIFVKVKMTPDSRYDYVMLEDPLPAGCEVVTNTNGYTIPGEPEYDQKAREEQGYWYWNWWYADRNVRDEKVTFFAREMQQKNYEFSYIMRAQIPGKYSVLPSVGALMYYPEVRGNSGDLALTITP